MPVRCQGKRNGKKLSTLSTHKNNAHFDGPTTIIESGPCSARACLEHIAQVVCAVHTGACSQFGAVQCGVGLSMLKCVPGCRMQF